MTGSWKPFRPVDRAMARRMERTVSVPIATEFTHVEVVAAERAVRRLREADVPATLTSVILAATAPALRAHPEVTAEVDFEEWRRRVPASVHVGVAVAADRGLVVPVVRDVTTKTTVDLAFELDRTVRAARSGTAEPSLYRGGHFTITNMGRLPIYGGLPLPNTPQIAILSVGAAWDAAVVTDGVVGVSRLLRLTIAIDHRALDGITAAHFLVAVKDRLESADEWATPDELVADAARTDGARTSR